MREKHAALGWLERAYADTSTWRQPAALHNAHALFEQHRSCQCPCLTLEHVLIPSAVAVADAPSLLRRCRCAVVISFNTLGLGVNDDAGREASLAAASANQLLESLTRAALNAFSSGLETISMPLLSFITAYVARLRALVKRGEQLPPSAKMHLQVM